MADSDSAVDSGSSQVGGHYSAALDNLRSTVKWLVASAGAVAAAIIAGAQLVNYSDRNIWGAALAALAVATALVLTLLLLTRAARILTISRPTATDLANAEMRANALDTTYAAAGQITDDGVQWLLARRTYLLGPYASVNELLCAYNDAQADALRQADDEDARRALTEVELRIDTVEEAAHFRDVVKAYESLLLQFRTGAVVFVTAVVVFSVSGLLHKDVPDKPANPVTAPLPVRVVRTGSDDQIPQLCRDRDGVAVGGTLTQPTVVLSPSPQCPAEVVVGGQKDAVVIPKLPATTGAPRG